MRILISFTLYLLLFGCHSAYYNKQQRVAIADNVQYQLISQLPFNSGFSMLQSATIQFQDETHQLLFQTEVRQRSLVMVGLTPTGTRLFTIEMQADSIQATGLPSADQLKPEYLLADLQLCLWPAAKLQSHLSGAQLLQPSPLERVLMVNNQPVIRIIYSEPVFYQGSIDFHHLQRNYRLKIEPITIEDRPHDQ